MDSMTTHGLRCTMAFLVLEAGHSDVPVSMRTGHRDLNSLKNYQNLFRSEGKKQHKSIFDGSSASKDRKRRLGLQEEQEESLKKLKVQVLTPGNHGIIEGEKSKIERDAQGAIIRDESAQNTTSSKLKILEEEKRGAQSVVLGKVSAQNMTISVTEMVMF